MNRLLAQAEDEAKKLKDEYVSIEHLLLAMTDDGGAAGRILKEFGITREKLAAGAQRDPRQPAGDVAESGSDL